MRMQDAETQVTAQSKRGSRRGRAVVGSWRLALWGLWRHGGMGASKQALGAIGWPPAARVIMSYDVIKSVSWMKGDHTGEQDRKGTSYTSTLSGYMMIPTRSNSDTSDNARPPRRSLSLCADRQRHVCWVERITENQIDRNLSRE